MSDWLASSGGANGSAALLMIGGVILLVVLMVVREFVSLLQGGEWVKFARYLNVAILPLFIAFALRITAIIANFVSHPPPVP